jgi:hypothetical protein
MPLDCNSILCMIVRVLAMETEAIPLFGSACELQGVPRALAMVKLKLAEYEQGRAQPEQECSED